MNESRLPELFVATKNAGKAKEFRQMLGQDRFIWKDLSSAAEDIEAPEETGRTFLTNAVLKASFYAKAVRSWALADDSGLEIDALDGAPGVVSARWAQIHNAGHGDADNNTLVLKQLEHVPEQKRTARFVCALALCDAKGQVILTARDSAEGRMLREARGSNGFGYDPLFYVDALGKTTAELTGDEKHAISHRGKALRRLRALMDKFAVATHVS